MSIDAMSHEQAVRNRAVERYLLGELTQDEREAFEGHYFECSPCFDELKLSKEFLGHAREILDPEPEKESWLSRMLGDLRRPVPAFAAAMLVCAIGLGAYQQSVISDLQAPKIQASVFLPPDAKGGEKLISVSRKSSLSLNVDLQSAAEFPAYRARILSKESGKVKYTVPLAAQQAKGSVTIGLLSAGILDAGKYSVVIQGLASDGSATDVGNGSFELQFTD